MWWLSFVVVACAPESAVEPAGSEASVAGVEVEPGWHPVAPLVAEFGEREVVVHGPWPGAPEVGVSLLGWGDAGAPQKEGPRTSYAHDGLTAWWERRPGGLEQGFTVTAVPDGELVLELSLRGASSDVDADGVGATWRLEGGGELRYEGLAAWDSVGTELPARMEATAEGLRLVVETEGAVGPVTVDPVFPGADWSAESNQASASFGGSVASAGDVNGDGFDDVVVGASGYDNGQTNEGVAVLYLGSAAGLSSVPAWTAESNQANASFGGSVASAGDVNGDGYDDVVVGAFYHDNGQTDEGAAFLYLGSATGLSALPAWTAESNQAYAHFGVSVASAGDVNGDGYDDVVVGADGYDRVFNEGAAFLYLGSAAGLSAVPAWTAESNQQSANFGVSVSSAGDVNGDGYDDVVVGASFYGYFPVLGGAAFLYLGSAAGLSSVPAWTEESNQADAYLGVSVASAGDVNGDGYDDVVVGASSYGYDQFDEGVAFLYLGSAGGLSAVPAWRAESNQGYSWFGWSVASAGDVNGDGYDDVVVGAPHYDSGEIDEGMAFLYMGSAVGLSSVPAWTAESNQASASFGWSVASAGDVNGDGHDDFVVGAPGSGRGTAFLWYFHDGDGDNFTDEVDDCPFVFDPAQLDTDGDGMGDACDDPALTVEGVVSSAGPVTLVATGAPGEQVWFGAAVGGGSRGPCLPLLGGLCMDLGPGVVNLGSAFVDVTGVATLPLVVPAAVLPNGTYVVQAAIARGVGGADSVKSSVLLLDGTTLDWDGDGLVDADELLWGTDPRDADTDGDGLIDSEELQPFLDPLVADTDGDGVLDGADVCWAGDDALDGDGDLIPDACDDCPVDANPGQRDTDGDGLGDACEGAVLVGPPWTVESNQADATFGTSVASAGDVNGDGYDDVVVGASGYYNGQAFEGAAFLYLGSAAGLSATPAWTAESNQAYAYFGHSVTSAGDVNGDGYDDVVVGTYGYDNGQTNEGAAFLYLGSAAGLSAVPAWTAESNQAHARFGFSVASAGDVNGDGYDDVVVGADRYDNGQTNEGAAFLYLGSAGGLSAVPAWTAESNQASAWFGTSVASAGDVNGDGYDDVVVGAYQYDNGETDEGAAFLYLGSAAGLSAVPAWTAESNQESAHFGFSVATAGDVNGDGYDDVVVGAPESAGTAFLYLGSAAGLSAVPAWTESPQWGAYFGSSVASAGDVNGDGYDDVVVGASMYDHGQIDEGAALLYLGAASGLSSAQAWLGESNLSWFGYYGYYGSYYGPEFGASVASAGDVDGDGLSDVLVGAPRYQDGQVGEGRAYLYYGNSP